MTKVIPHRLRRSAVVLGRVISRRAGVLPDFLIAGTQRGGTTGLYSFLVQQLNVRRPLQKEIHFFDRFYSLGEGWYRAHFPKDTPERSWITGEATPDYLFDPMAPIRIARLIPQVRAVVLLRDPVERAFSAWKLMRRKGREHRDFETAITNELEGKQRGRPEIVFRRGPLAYLGRGRYVEQLERWTKALGRDRMLIVRSEDLFVKPLETINDVLGFLDLPGLVEASLPQAYATEAGSMDPAVRDRLYAYFEPHNDRLASMLERDMGWMI